MTKRIVALLILVGICGGGAWYFLRNTPGKTMLRLRDKINALVFKDSAEGWRAVVTDDELGDRSLDDVNVRLDIARAASDVILDIDPLSQADMEVRGLIEERAGKPAAALRWYDKVNARPRPVPRVSLRRARLLEAMGLHEQAKGALASVLDEFPFEANLGLGRVHLKAFETFASYRALKRAIELARDDEQRRRVYEPFVDTLDQLMASERRRAAALGPDRQPAEAARLQHFSGEREAALEAALSLWRLSPAESRADFVRAKLKIFELSRRKGGRKALVQAVEALSKAVRDDEERRYVPIYLTLGAVEFQLAYGEEGQDRKRRIARAEENYRKAFTFRLSATEEIEKLTGWAVPDLKTEEEFDAFVLVRACQGLLAIPEFVRVLSDKNAAGAPDVLEIESRVNRLIGSATLADDWKRGLGLARAWAYLKSGQKEEFRAAIDSLLAATDQTDAFVLRTVRGIALYAPGSFDEGLRLLSTADLRDRGVALSVVGVLRQARGAVSADDHPVLAEQVTARLHDVIGGLATTASDVGEVLLASRLMATLVDAESAVPILEAGLGTHSESEAILFALGVAYSQLADRKDRPELRALAFESLLKLFRSRPHSSDIATRLRRVTDRLSAAGDLPAIATAIQHVFACLASQAERVAPILQAFFTRRYDRVVAAELSGDEEAGLRPFLNLLVGISCLEHGRVLLEDATARNPLAGRVDLSRLRSDITALESRAREEFERGIAIDETYVPILLELARFDLEVADEREALEAILARLRDIARGRPEVAQVHYLQSRVVRKLRTQADPKRSRHLLADERGLLRKAIRANPDSHTAYQALADTFTEPRGRARVRASDYDKAIRVLKSAPPVPGVLRQIGDLYRASERLSEARVYYEALAYLQPIESNLTRVVGTIVRAKEYGEARSWLNEIRERHSSDPDFVARTRTLLALVAAAEAGAESTPKSRREALEDEQIELYRENLASANAKGERAAAYDINNLAYLLAKRDRFEEALEIIRPLYAEFVARPDSQPSSLVEMVEETYAWCLYRSGDLGTALDIYRKLCSEKNELEFHLNYANVLYDDRQYEEAERQVQTVLSSRDDHADTVEDRALRLRGKIRIALQRKFDQKVRDRR